MNKTFSIILVLIVVIILVFIIIIGNSKEDEGGVVQVVFSIRDAAADMSGVNEVSATTGKIELYSESEGWVTVATDGKTYKLLDLRNRGEAALMARANVDAGTYDRVRFELKEVMVDSKAK